MIRPLFSSVGTPCRVGIGRTTVACLLVRNHGTQKRTSFRQFLSVVIVPSLVPFSLVPFSLVPFSLVPFSLVPFSLVPARRRGFC